MFYLNPLHPPFDSLSARVKSSKNILKLKFEIWVLHRRDGERRIYFYEIKKNKCECYINDKKLYKMSSNAQTKFLEWWYDLEPKKSSVKNHVCSWGCWGFKIFTATGHAYNKQKLCVFQIFG